VHWPAFFLAGEIAGVPAKWIDDELMIRSV
jgi:hypothetical protein